MKVRLPPGALAAGGLLIAAAVLFLPEGARWDFSRSRTSSLKPRTIQLLRQMKQPVTAAYYVSSRARMPTDYKNMEREVAYLFRQMGRTSQGKFTWSSADPEEDDRDLRLRLDGMSLAPFQVKTIRQDEMEVDSVWSALVLRSGDKKRDIPFLSPSHLPHLEDRIAALLDNMERPRLPRVALSAPDGYSLLRAALAKEAEVFSFDFQKEPLPPNTELALLVQPAMSRDKASAVREYLADGKNVFLFATPYEIFVQKEAVQNVTFRVEDLGLPALLEEMGVAFHPEAVLEETRAWKLVIHNTWINLEPFREKTMGHVLFPAAAPLDLNPAALNKAGLRAEILMHAPSRSWTRPADGKPVAQTELLRSPLTTAGSFPLAAALRSAEPWQGALFLYASRFLFEDSTLHSSQPNQSYLQNIVMTFLSEDKRLSIRASRLRPEPLKPLGPAARFFWRFAVVFVVPFGLVGWLFHSRSGELLGLRRFKGPALALAGGAAMLAIVRALPAIRLDVSQDAATRLSPEFAARVAGLANPIKLEYITSAPETLGREGRRLAAAARAKLREIRRASRGRLSIYPTTVNPRDDNKESLARRGVRPFALKVVQGDSFKERSAVSAFILEDEGGRREVVSPVDLAALPRMEFLLADALERLAGREPYKVAFLSDPPRLSPADAYMDYMRLDRPIREFPDPFSRAAELLSDYGFEVQRFSPGQDADLNADLIFLLQPFQVSTKTEAQINAHLRSGRNALVAAQLFDIRRRRYAAFKTGLIYWPRSHFTRIGDFLKPYGMKLVWEIIFDESHGAVPMETEWRPGAVFKETFEEPSALPFILRALPQNFKPSPVTERLSPILFPAASRPAKLEIFPPTLRWTELITTTDKTWSYAWNGGFLSRGVMEYPTGFVGPLPLAVMVEGKFPPLESMGDRHAKDAKMLLIGNSECFQDVRLEDQAFGNRDLLLNSVIFLTHGEAMTRLHARGNPVRRDFKPVLPYVKDLWRWLVVFFGPALLSTTWLFGRFRSLLPNKTGGPARE